MKVLIVDDEFNSRRVVRKIISDSFPEITFLNDASSVEEAIAIIQEDHPDILLLDIQLNSKTSFEILNQIERKEFEIVFITAYDNYALKAFDVGAVNYVLKPIDREKLKSIMEKLIKQVSFKKNAPVAEKNVSPLEKLLLPSGETSKIIEVKDILYVKADGVYCELHLNNAQGKILVVKPLNYLEGKLEGHPHFFRVHKSYLINMNSITSISADRTSLQLLDKINIPIARLRKDELKKRLENNFY